MAKHKDIKTLINQSGKVITLKSLRHYDYIPLQHIVYIKANSNYSSFQTIHQKIYITTKPIKYYEGLLENYGFIRINRSYIINRQHLIRYNLDTNIVTFTNDITIMIGNRTKTKLLEL